jgi:SNF2 family DNA or RNA helicase
MQVEADFSNEFDHGSLSRGFRYFKEGHVLFAEEDENELHALVQGTRSSPYSLQIPFSQGFIDLEQAYCDCPVGYRCKHIAAVLFHVHQQEKRELEQIDLNDLSVSGKLEERKIILLDQRTAAGESSLLSLLPTQKPVRHTEAAAKREKWRIVFVVYDGRENRDLYTDEQLGPDLQIAPFLQLKKKRGGYGRMQRYCSGPAIDEDNPAAFELLDRCLLSGKGTPLGIHFDFLLQHPEIPLFGDLFSVPQIEKQGDELLCAEVQASLRFEPQIFRYNESYHAEFRPYISMELADRSGTFTAGNNCALSFSSHHALLLLDYNYLFYFRCSPLHRDFIEKTVYEAPYLKLADIKAIEDRLNGQKETDLAVYFPYTRIHCLSIQPKMVLHISPGNYEDETALLLEFAYEKPEGGFLDTDLIFLSKNSEYEEKAEAAIRNYLSGLTAGEQIQAVPRLTEHPFYLEKPFDRFIAEDSSSLLDKGIEIRLFNGTALEKEIKKIKIEVRTGIDWFDLKVTTEDGLDLKDINTASPLFNAGLLYFKGKFLRITAEDREKLFQLALMFGKKKNRIKKKDFAGLIEAASLIEGPLPPDFQRRMEIGRLLLDTSSLPAQPVPEGFRGQLREYQVTGFRWLTFLADNGLNGCLADDMGLGKTVQTLAFLQLLKERGGRGSSLITAPVSTLYNWRREAERFTPELSVIIHHGSGRADTASDICSADIVLTSYATLRIDSALFEEIEFASIILDESQAIKNPRSKIFKAAASLSARHRFVLTGTPVENSVLDLWSQMEFLEPAFLGGYKEFKKKYARSPAAEEKDAAGLSPLKQLNAIIRPFVLRRTKGMVAPELPRREEIRHFVDMLPKQRKVYDAVKQSYRKQLKAAIAAGDLPTIGSLFFTGMLRLRQICCYPETADKSYAGLPAAKDSVFRDLIWEILIEGHKVLVFSQFTSVLAKLRQAVESYKLSCLYLDGATRDRASLIDRFQNDESERIFLISLKAGGVGINLTAADYVILFDPWWNPKVENQAVDRTHRIGQTKPVFIYKLITRNSIEEQVLALQEKKSAIADEIISEDTESVFSLSEEEIMQFFGD